MRKKMIAVAKISFQFGPFYFPSSSISITLAGIV